jgi:hypothetical protein
MQIPIIILTAVTGVCYAMPTNPNSSPSNAAVVESSQTPDTPRAKYPKEEESDAMKVARAAAKTIGSGKVWHPKAHDLFFVSFEHTLGLMMLLEKRLKRQMGNMGLRLKSIWMLLLRRISLARNAKGELSDEKNKKGMGEFQRRLKS